MANQSKDNPKHDKLQQGDDNRQPQEQFPSSGSGRAARTRPKRASSVRRSSNPIAIVRSTWTRTTRHRPPAAARKVVEQVRQVVDEPRRFLDGGG